LDCDPPVDAYFIARMTGMCHHAQLISRDGGLKTFYQGWPKPRSYQSLPPELLGLQACATILD
jgi:hypothetical protein